MPKPHITLSPPNVRQNFPTFVWYCRTAKGNYADGGFGRTPQAAYSVWKKNNVVH